MKPLERREKITAYSLLVILLLGTALSIQQRKEYWPFCYYPMFRQISLRTHTQDFELRGVTPEGSEVHLTDPSYFAPLSHTRIRRTMQRIEEEPRILDFLYLRYQELREQGRHDGPKIVALRLYLLSWEDVTAVSFDPSKPDLAQMVLEFKP